MSTKAKDQVELNEDEFDIEDEETQEVVKPSRLEALKTKANKLGIKFRANISEDALAQKIDNALAGEAKSKEEEEEDPEDDLDEEEQEQPKPKVKKLTAEEQRLEERKRSQRLIRIIARPIDPRRTQLEGEMIMVGNGAIGMTGKFVPFNREEGYHVPEVIYNALRDKQFTEFYTVTDKHGNENTKSRQKRAFVIEVLDPLTEAELAEIRTRQRATLVDE